MYALARRGVAIERKFNEVTVHWLQVTQTDDKTITFTVRCSCGTYVRSLGYLLANELGTVGHLTQLRRLQIGPYDVSKAFDGKLLKTSDRQTLAARIIPCL